MLRPAPRPATIAFALMVGLVVLAGSGGGEVRAQSQLGTPGAPMVPAPTPPAAPTAPTTAKPAPPKTGESKTGESKTGQSKAGESKAGESKAGHKATTRAQARPKPAAPARHVPVVGAGKRPERVAPATAQRGQSQGAQTQGAQSQRGQTQPAPTQPAHAAPAQAAAKPAAPAGPAAPTAPESAPVKPAEPDKGSATGLPLPRFAALRSDEVNLRAGPGTRYPIAWVYKRRNLPVKIEREFEVWRLVEDADGVKGWVHQATLTGRRGLLITGAERTLRAAAADGAAPVARLKPGVVGQILHCDAASDWCQVQVKEYRGFLRRSEFWGTTTGEAVN